MYVCISRRENLSRSNEASKPNEREKEGKSNVPSTIRTKTTIYLTHQNQTHTV